MLPIIPNMKDMTFHLASYPILFILFPFRDQPLRHMFDSEKHMQIFFPSCAFKRVLTVTDDYNACDPFHTKLGFVGDEKMGSGYADRRG
jgi:hypothetical protein